MREYLEQATHDIACGFDPDVVINTLLVEKSIWSPSGHARLPKWAGGSRRIPGGLAAAGAVTGAALKGYLANKEAKKKGLKGKDKLKHVAKGAAKGAAIGAVSGYGAKLAGRAAASHEAAGRHLKRRSKSFWVKLAKDPKYRESTKDITRTVKQTHKVRRRAERVLKTREAKTNLSIAALLAKRVGG